MILVSGFDRKKGTPIQFDSIKTSWYIKNLVTFSTSISVVFPLLLFLLHQAGSMYVIAGLVILPIIIVNLLFTRYRRNKETKWGNDFSRFENNNLYAAYSVILNFGLKLSILIICYGFMLEYFFGNLIFLILVTLITISGLILTINGLLAYLRTGVVTGIAFIMSVILLTVFKMGFDKSVLTIVSLNQQSIQAFWFIPMFLIFSGLWINEFRQPVQNISADDRHIFKNELVTIVILILGLAVLISILLNIEVKSTYTIGLHSNITQFLEYLNIQALMLIVIGAPFTMGLVSIFQSTSTIIVEILFKNKQSKKSDNVQTFAHQLAIVVLVALVILLTPLFSTASLEIFQLLFILYLSFLIPELVFFGFTLIGYALDSKTMKICLLFGTLPTIFIAVFYVIHKFTQTQLIYILSIQLVYTVLCVYLTEILVGKAITNNVKNKIPFPKIETGDVFIKK
jgi:hypothetical protein